MSWIYSIVFASLFVSSDLQIEQQPSYNNPNTPAAVVTVENDETEKFDQTYPISANGRVSVSNVNGSIEMVAWDRNEVRLEATKIADSKESLGDVGLKIDSTGDSFSVEAEYKQWNWRERKEKGRYNVEVRFRLSVPRTAVLNEIETVNGSVVAANFTNLTKISAVNGSVNAANLRGTAHLSTVNGTVTADFDRVEQGTKIELSTVNGRINLALPSDTNATIKADSLNGAIVNGFGLPIRKGEYVGRDLHGRLGSGDAQIKLDSVNGPLAINKKDDGKSASPAVNLLSASGRDGSHRDANRAVSDDARQARLDAQKDAADARREAARAIREANREMANIRIPDLKELKIDIDDKQIQESIREGMKIQEKVLARMQDAMFFSGTPMVERKTNSFTIEGTPKVVIDAPNCNVRIRGWDKNEVKYVLTEYRDLRSGDEVKVKETNSKSEVNLVVNGGDLDAVGGPAPRLEVFVPRKSNLKVKTDGEIRVEGVTGELNLTGQENSIDVRGAGGRLTVSNSDGVVRVIDFNGDLAAQTKDGEIYLDGNFDRINASSVDGRYVVTLPEGVDAEVSASGGSFTIEDLANGKELSKNNWRFGKGGRKYIFNSESGHVELRNRDLLNSER